MDLKFSLGLLFALGAATAAQDDKKKQGGFKPNPLIDQKRVDEAIRKGIGFLKTSDSPASHGVANSDDLKLLTFIHAGLSEQDPVFQELLKRCLEARLDKTYQVVLLAMCLEELDRVKYQSKIAACGQFLIDNQKPNGGWTYGVPSVYTEGIPTTAPRKAVDTAGGKTRPYDPALAGEKQKPKVTQKIPLKKMKEGPSERSDNSNSQYAALGMRACHDAGIVFPKELIQKAWSYWAVQQHPAGEKGKRPAVGPDTATGGPALVGDPRGWCYREGDETCGRGGPPYASMTSGAVGAVCIYDYMLGKDWKKDKVVLDGLAWLDKNWSVTENLHCQETAGGVPNAQLYYYLYAVERAGMLYDTTLIGSHDWYLDGARVLLEAQKADGSWSGSRYTSAAGVEPTWDTCFAILFLKRATRRLDVATTSAGR